MPALFLVCPERYIKINVINAGVLSTMTTSTHSDILALPKPKAPQKKQRQSINSKAQCITDNEVLQELKAWEIDKLQKEEKRVHQQERQQKKLKERACKKPTRKKSNLSSWE